MTASAVGFAKRDPGVIDRVGDEFLVFCAIEHTGGTWAAAMLHLEKSQNTRGFLAFLGPSDKHTIAEQVVATSAICHEA
jgi:hypothetical protein